ncbi:MAG TPA: adenylate/guanylate cyclase domain-containing protein [Acidimicrobiia bacterium]|nr:adenylate/guanylate cyclase domain-containing protein [Acidimicrobiia bacterium]
MQRPETQYARNGDIHLAFQVYGDGPVDVVSVPGFVSNLDDMWESPDFHAAAERMARVARVIRFDKRGIGMSDRDVPVGTLEERMDDVRAVMDAAESEQAVLLGTSEGGPLCALFAATHADRTRALVLAASWARLLRGPDYPIGVDPEGFEQFIEMMVANWGTGRSIGTFFRNSLNEPPIELLARMERHSASPGALRRIFEMLIDTDVTGVLSTITAPTLVLHSRDDRQVPFALGEYLAEHIPGARLEEIEGSHGDAAVGDQVPAYLEQLLTGDVPVIESDRVLATVLFTDIVDSTARASSMGDAAWRSLLDRHDEIVFEAVGQTRGRVVKHTGDGVLASFDGPARGVTCAHRIVRAARDLGIEIRAGLHTGECEARGDDLGGIAVHVGARVAALAQPSEVLVTRTVKDLVAGSGLQFSERGEHELKGVSDRWQLFASQV